MNLQSAQKAIALIPLALLSTAWTASLVGVGSSSVDDRNGATLPDGATVPVEALESPASWSDPRRLGLGVPRASAGDVVATASTRGIPAAALAAYQRAVTVMDAADRECGIDWQLIAAVGRVESDHGRYGGSTLTTDGVSRPGIYGIALDGTNGTAEITDTDAGRLDEDPVHDRAVGPMQFIPSTWSEVGVDADGDGQRNPQDVDDAALASAVHLCSGEGALTTDAGRRTAVLRYNHSRAYADLVLAVRESYVAGEYTSVPSHVASAVTFTPDRAYAAPQGTGSHPKPTGSQAGSGAGPSTGGGTTTTDPKPTSPAADEPSQTNDPVRQLEETLTKTVEDTTTTVRKVLSLPQAMLTFASLGYNALTTPAEWNACIARHTGR